MPRHRRDDMQAQRMGRCIIPWVPRVYWTGVVHRCYARMLCKDVVLGRCAQMLCKGCCARMSCTDVVQRMLCKG